MLHTGRLPTSSRRFTKPLRYATRLTIPCVTSLRCGPDHVVQHGEDMDGDARVAQVRATRERGLDVALERLISRLHRFLLRGMHHLEHVDDTLHTAYPARIFLGRRLRLIRRHHAEEGQVAVHRVDVDVERRRAAVGQQAELRRGRDQQIPRRVAHAAVLPDQGPAGSPDLRGRQLLRALDPPGDPAHARDPGGVAHGAQVLAHGARPAGEEHHAIDRTAMRLPASALSVPSAFSTSSRISASARLTSLSRWPPTTWRMLRTSFTPSTVLTASSALAFSSAVRTLPCKVMRPFTVSTLMVPPRSPSVASRAILALVVIQASRVLARAARVPVSARTAASAAPPIHVATRITLSLQGTGRAPRARSGREPSPRQGRPGRVETYTSTSRATLQGRVLGADPAGWALFTRASRPSRPFGDAGCRELSDQPRPSLKEVLRGFLQDNRNAMLGSAPLAAPPCSVSAAS